GGVLPLGRAGAAGRRCELDPLGPRIRPSTVHGVQERAVELRECGRIGVGEGEGLTGGYLSVGRSGSEDGRRGERGTGERDQHGGESGDERRETDTKGDEGGATDAAVIAE